MERIWIALFLACGVAIAPLSHAQDENAPQGAQQDGQKAAGEKKADKADKNEAGKKKGEKKDGAKKGGEGDKDPGCDE
ncbi:MAG: hypothetical protein AB1710_10175 [Pseudomonadota bacterium]